MEEVCEPATKTMRADKGRRMILPNIIRSVVKNRLGIVQYPSFITFATTWRCNAKCIFCDVWKKNARKNEELSVDDIGAIFGQLKGLDVLRITGGEPFLRTDLAEVINRINDVNPPTIIHLTTNGTLPGRIITTMKKICPIEKIHIKISIDNIGKKHDEARGLKGAYEKAMETVSELAALRDGTGFHLGVNQAIVEEKEVDSYFELKEVLQEYDVPIYPVIANDPTHSLYSERQIVNPDVSLKPFKPFSKGELKRFLSILIEDGKKVRDWKERIVDRYHLKGLYNRLVEYKNVPNPPCVALNNHLRILPNGDVPVCLYNGSIVGNLRREKFKNIWFGKKVKRHRQWVKKCSGCWQSCETAVSAIYTGDIWKGLL
jgi:MoaA/NifB/PqqE/SkfB family radical SAM enzyme